MKVSVCIPNYNYAPYLPDCLESVFLQRYEPLEVLVSDDASTDGSLAYLQSIDDARCTLLSQPTNLGRLKNINTVLQASSGELVTLLPSDDLLMEDAIARRAAILEQNPDVVMVFCGVQKFGAAHEVHVPYPASFVESGERFRRRLLRNNMIFTASVLVRRSALEAVGWFDEEIAVEGSRDWLLWLLLTHQGSVAYLPDVLVCERVHPHNVTQTFERGADISEHELGVLFAYFERTPSSVQEQALAYQALYDRVLVRAIRQSTVLANPIAAAASFAFAGTLEFQFGYRSIRRRMLETVLRIPGIPSLVCLLPRSLTHRLRAWLHPRSTPTV